MESKLMVSISCITFNHENYIGRAIESFLSQETNFKIEILIHDDASTDETQEIIRKYEQKFPDIIKPIYQKENQYSKGNKRMNAEFNFPRAQGKYIAFCEGDDYWTDNFKLQKQVDFLEKNLDYNLCGSRAQLYHEETGKMTKSEGKIYGNVSLNDVLRKNQFSTCTAVLRKANLDQALFSNWEKFFTGDWSLWCGLLRNGKGYNFKEVTAQYTVHSGGITSGRKKGKTLRNKLEDRMFMIDNFPKKKKIIKGYGKKIIFHYLWKSMLLQKEYYDAILKNKNLVLKFLAY